MVTREEIKKDINNNPNLRIASKARKKFFDYQQGSFSIEEISKMTHVKVEIIAPNGIGELIWFKIKRIKFAQDPFRPVIIGTLANSPLYIPNMHFGDRATIDLWQIIDVYDERLAFSRRGKNFRHNHQYIGKGGIP